MSSSRYRLAPGRAAAAAVASLIPFSHGVAQDAASNTTASNKGSVSLPPVVVVHKEHKAAGKKANHSTPAAANSGPGVEDHEAPRQSEIGLRNDGLAVPLSATQRTSRDFQSMQPGTSSTADLIADAPGVSIFRAGGVSGIPALNGLADDRVKVLLNGMVVSSACANHMNPPLSYADPAQVGYVEVLTGVAPVSKGGDSLGGTVIVESHPPHFASPEQGVHTAGSLSASYRSNGDGIGTAATAHAATETVSVNYAGAWRRSGNYDDGRGTEVYSTEYEAQNHSVQLAIRNGSDVFIVQGGLQYIPYQGFVNQRMDMVDNQAWFLSTRYVGTFGWGKLDARAFYQHTDHEMNFLSDKKYNKAPPYRNMPMLTEGEDMGYAIKAEIPLSQRDLLRVGNELHHQALDDWWPATMAMVSMMGPDTYLTINDGTRTRLGTFIEWERKWDHAWSTLFGVRNDVVWMDTGDVHGYNAAVGGMGGVYALDAAAFNARNHERTDTNIDVTALARYEPNRNTSYEAGYAMKSRAPNLYERYAWSRVDGPMDNAQMAMSMIGWFGDGNGYVGNLDLESETAHTVSVTTGWHDGARKDWEFKVTPYYTYVEDYIGVRKIGNAIGQPGFVNLEFVNHDAELYGINFAGSVRLLASRDFGEIGLSGRGGYVHGENVDTGVSLYHMMPLHARLALTHALGGWSSAVELDLVGGKHNVDTTRNELETAGYALVNLRTSYEVDNWRFDLGVTNLFDTYFEDPLAGHYIEPTMSGHIGGVAAKGNVPGEGRSFNAGLTVKF
jgi:iron complex outermembrane receptor protein